MTGYDPGRYNDSFTDDKRMEARWDEVQVRLASLVGGACVCVGRGAAAGGVAPWVRQAGAGSLPPPPRPPIAPCPPHTTRSPRIWAGHVRCRTLNLLGVAPSLPPRCQAEERRSLRLGRAEDDEAEAAERAQAAAKAAKKKKQRLG